MDLAGVAHGGFAGLLEDDVEDEDQLTRQGPGETVQCQPAGLRIPKAFLKGGPSGSTGNLGYSGRRD